jgi:hypothetical protein
VSQCRQCQLPPAPSWRPPPGASCPGWTSSSLWRLVAALLACLVTSRRLWLIRTLLRCWPAWHARQVSLLECACQALITVAGRIMVLDRLMLSGRLCSAQHALMTLPVAACLCLQSVLSVPPHMMTSNAHHCGLAAAGGAVDASEAAQPSTRPLAPSAIATQPEPSPSADFRILAGLHAQVRGPNLLSYCSYCPLWQQASGYSMVGSGRHAILPVRPLPVQLATAL